MVENPSLQANDGQMKIPTIGRIQKNRLGNPKAAFQFPRGGIPFKIPASVDHKVLSLQQQDGAAV